MRKHLQLRERMPGMCLFAHCIVQVCEAAYRQKRRTLSRDVLRENKRFQCIVLCD